MKNLTKALKYGFTLIEIIIVTAIIGMLAVSAIPAMQKARRISRRNICISNLRLIEKAKEQWAMDNNGTEQDEVYESDVDPYIKGGLNQLFCPQGKTPYTPGKTGTLPQCPNVQTFTGHVIYVTQTDS